MCMIKSAETPKRLKQTCASWHALTPAVPKARSTGSTGFQNERHALKAVRAEMAGDGLRRSAWTASLRRASSA
jgi:hypothetical protein